MGDPRSLKSLFKHNLMKDDQNLKKRDVKKGGSNKKGESAMALCPPRPLFSTHKYF